MMKRPVILTKHESSAPGFVPGTIMIKTRLVLMCYSLQLRSANFVDLLMVVYTSVVCVFLFVCLCVGPV